MNTKGYFPFVFLMAMVLPKSDERLYKIPIYGYITKPLDEVKLLNTLEVALLRITSERQLDFLVSKLREEIEKRETVEKKQLFVLR